MKCNTCGQVCFAKSSGGMYDSNTAISSCCGGTIDYNDSVDYSKDQFQGSWHNASTCAASDLKTVEKIKTTICTVYFETLSLRHSVECDLIDDCIVTTIEYLIDKIKSQHNNPKIKTILFSEVNDIE